MERSYCNSLLSNVPASPLYGYSKTIPVQNGCIAKLDFKKQVEFMQSQMDLMRLNFRLHKFRFIKTATGVTFVFSYLDFCTFVRSYTKTKHPSGCFISLYAEKGIRTRRDHAKRAEENAPVERFRRRGQGAKRREGAGRRRKIPIPLPNKKPPQGGFLFGRMKSPLAGLMKE